MTLRSSALRIFPSTSKGEVDTFRTSGPVYEWAFIKKDWEKVM
jgi:hypothetical protein